MLAAAQLVAATTSSVTTSSAVSTATAARLDLADFVLRLLWTHKRTAPRTARRI